MSLESLVEEIRRRGEADVRAIADARAVEEAKIVAERDRILAEIQRESVRSGEAEAARGRSQRLAAAKLEARKRVYAAREVGIEHALRETQELLSDVRASGQYPTILKRMVQAATERLGKQVRVSGRKDDAELLAKVAGKMFDPAPRPILGGLIAETADGRRRLNLSFDELLRLREDRVREILS